MGADKAALAWGGTTLLAHVAGRLAAAVDGPLVVVGSPVRALPEPGVSAEVLVDPVEGDGPLRGIAVALAALAGRARVAVVAGVDQPFLEGAVMRALAVAALGDELDASAVRSGGRLLPIPAAYRPELAPLAARLLDGGERRTGLLLERARTRVVDLDELRAAPGVAAADPDLRSLVSLNDPRAYLAARRSET